MKSFASLCLLAGLLLAPGLAVHAAPVVGQPAPDFTLTDIQGNTHRLSSYHGRVVVLEWVNPECPFVRKHYEGSGNMPATQQAVTSGGAVWLSINSARANFQGDFSPDEVATWSKQTGAAPTAYLRDADGTVGKLYDARHTPTLFLIDATGRLVYAGGIDDINSANPRDIARARNHVKAAFADLQAGRPVGKPVSRAYGCSIKYAK